MNEDIFQNEDDEELFTQQQNPYGNHQTESSEQNPYGDHQTESSEQNPYGNYQTEGPGQNPYENDSNNATSGKKQGVGLGIVSMILGIISLLCFCSGLNVITGVIAIVFGIVQIVTCEKKGMAIAGIVTAAISIVLCIGCYALIFSNHHFIQMIEEEVVDGFDDDQNIQDFIQKYQNGDNFEYRIYTNPDDGNYQDEQNQGNGEEIL